MSVPASSLSFTTRPVTAELAAVLHRLKPGQQIRVTQTVRVGRRHWTTTVTGSFRELLYLATGISTNRVPEDDIVVPTVHFTKGNGELSSVALDEHSRIEIIDG